MPGKLPRVSIGLPVYNGEKYLACALDSLLNQTFTDFEIIISDNASTDSTFEICEEYAARDDRIRLVRQPENIGAVGNFNRVFEISTGEYFKWAAYDDVCAPTFLEKCVAVLDRDLSIVCCHAVSVPIDKNGTQIDVSSIHTGRGSDRRRCGVAGNSANATSPLPPIRFRDVLLNTGFAIRCYGLIRSAKLRRTGMLLPVYGYEKVMMAELSLLGRFHVVPQPLFFQRVHIEASASLTSMADQQKFFAPQSTKRRTFPRLQYLKGYLRAVDKLSCGITDRLCCYFWIVAYLAQFRKWKRVLLGTLQGRGTGGANASLLAANQQHSAT